MAHFALRPYQTEAVRKMYRRRSQEGNELVVVGTGGGKSIIIAEFVHTLQKPVLILQPTKELLEQNMDKLLHYVDKTEVGVFSASMNQKTINTFTFATIGSVYKKPELFAHFSVVMLDECDLLSPKDRESMYLKFFSKIGFPKVYGLTATPFRMDTYTRKIGSYVESVTATRLINRMRDRFWHRLIVNINYKDLLEEGYLVPLEYLDSTLIEHNLIPRNAGADFDLDAYGEMVTEYEPGVVKDIRNLQDKYHSILVFCSTIQQADDIAQFVENAVVITGYAKKRQRKQIIDSFKTGKIQTVFNVNVLTVGFDHPALDCIVMLRPTRSIRLYTQMLGRGTRLAKGKKSCTIVDYSGNVKVFGRLETLILEKVDYKWELLSETGSWHLKELSSYIIRR